MALRMWTVKLGNLVKWLQKGFTRLHNKPKGSILRPTNRASLGLATHDEWYHDPISRTWTWLG